jgi:hypothetical protein
MGVVIDVTFLTYFEPLQTLVISLKAKQKSGDVKK